MTRVLRDYSKSELERIVEFATIKQVAAEAAYARLRRRVWSWRLLCGVVGFGLGVLFR